MARSLFTIVYSPKDRSRRHPILFTRTAYGIPPYGPDTYRTVIGPSSEFAKAGYIVAYQDVRGKFKSEGEFIHHSPIIAGLDQAEREHRHLRHDRLAREERPATTTAASGSGASPGVAGRSRWA